MTRIVVSRKRAHAPLPALTPRLSPDRVLQEYLADLQRSGRRFSYEAAVDHLRLMAPCTRKVARQMVKGVSTGGKHASDSGGA